LWTHSSFPRRAESVGTAPILLSAVVRLALYPGVPVRIKGGFASNAHALHGEIIAWEARIS
jgi:hypothetical protein